MTFPDTRHTTHDIRADSSGHTRHSPFATRAGYTLFELLAVLTIIGVSLTILVGSYGSWGTAHALTGAARIVENGLQQARTLAMARHAYVAFSYGSEVTNNTRVVIGFHPFLCQPNNSMASVEAVLRNTVTSPDNALGNILATELTVSETAPFQRLSGHVRLAYIREENLSSLSASAAPPLSQTYSDMTLFFRPDGSAFALGVTPEDTHAHTLLVYTQERFHRGGNAADPLYRLLRVDLATGLVTVITPGATP